MLRVHELATELGCSSNELLQELREIGSETVKAINALSPDDEKALRDKFGGKGKSSTAPTGKAQIGKKVSLTDGSTGYEPVRLKARDTGIKRDFRGTEQSASSTLAQRKPKPGASRRREQTTTKIIKKTIIRKRFVRTQDQAATGAPVEDAQKAPLRDEQQFAQDSRRPRKRRSLVIDGGVLPKAAEDTKPREKGKAPVTVPPMKKGGMKAPPVEPRRGRKRTPGTREPLDRYPKGRRQGYKTPPEPEKEEIKLKKSLERLVVKGISSDLTTTDRKGAPGKRTKKKRKKIMGVEKDKRFTRMGRRAKAKARDAKADFRGSVGTVRRKGRRKPGGRVEAPHRPPLPQRKVKVTPSMTIKGLSEATGIKAGEIIKFLVSDLGVFATINQVVDLDIIKLILENFGFEYDVRIREVEDEIEHEPDREEDLVNRPPVVVVLGHVDHGKTKLLDAIRHANVIDTEAGAITQHIGAYQTVIDDRKITFLDTPGHEAFTAMRARGAQVTDIAILVVACDDGVMPQTVEAINHARDANLEIIVALNKIDKDNADPERLKSQLAEYDFVPEEWGGKTIMVPVSAKLGQGIDDLLEMVILSADVLTLKGNPKVKAEGTVLEARLDKGLGAVATVLIKRGTLKVGDIVVCGASWGRVRQMTDENGLPQDEAGPSTPCQITGLSDVPKAGEKLYQVKDEKVAKDIYNQRLINQRMQKIHAVNRISLEDFFEQLEKGEVKDLNLILKADVQGSIEALVGSLEKLSTDEVRVKFVHAGVGNVNENDVMLAMASNAIVIGFMVKVGPEAKRHSLIEGVDIRVYEIIYKVVEDIELAIQGMLEPVFKEQIIGRAEIRAIFRKTRDSVIAGIYVTEGKMVRGMSIRIFRDKELIHEGKLDSLKRFQEDARVVEQDFECGIMLSGYNDLAEGDVIEGFEIIEVSRV